MNTQIPSDIKKELLKNNASVDLINNKGETPLFYANDPDIVDLLLKKGVDLQKKDHRGKTALSSNNMDLEVKKYLIEKGIDFSFLKIEKDTKHYNPDVTKYLNFLLKINQEKEVLKQVIDVEDNKKVIKRI